MELFATESGIEDVRFRQGLSFKRRFCVRPWLDPFDSAATFKKESSICAGTERRRQIENLRYIGRRFCGGAVGNCVKDAPCKGAAIEA
jgi:hypothetical protein